MFSLGSDGSAKMTSEMKTMRASAPILKTMRPFKDIRLVLSPRTQEAADRVGLTVGELVPLPKAVFRRTTDVGASATDLVETRKQGHESQRLRNVALVDAEREKIM